VNTKMHKMLSISKSGLIALAVSAVSLWSAGRAWADPTARPQESWMTHRSCSASDLNRSEDGPPKRSRGKLSSGPVWQLAQRMNVDHAALDRKSAPRSSSRATMAWLMDKAISRSCRSSR